MGPFKYYVMQGGWEGLLIFMTKCDKGWVGCFCIVTFLKQLCIWHILLHNSKFGPFVKEIWLQVER